MQRHVLIDEKQQRGKQRYNKSVSNISISQRGLQNASSSSLSSEGQLNPTSRNLTHRFPVLRSPGFVVSVVVGGFDFPLPLPFVAPLGLVLAVAFPLGLGVLVVAAGGRESRISSL